MKSFNEKTKEELKYYVYCLVDPRDNKVFYIGKGKGNRVFNHAEAAIETYNVSDKLEQIRDIIRGGKDVKYYIIRHGLDEDAAFEIESVLIDFLTYPSFNLEKVLTTIQSGHHSWDRGIKSVEEINIMYDCPEIELDAKDNIVFINVNKSYKRDMDIYEAAKGHWPFQIKRARLAHYVVVHYRGVVRAVYRPTAWHYSDEKGKVWFEGEFVPDSPYMNKSIKNVPLSPFRGACYSADFPLP